MASGAEKAIEVLEGIKTILEMPGYSCFTGQVSGRYPFNEGEIKRGGISPNPLTCIQRNTDACIIFHPNTCKLFTYLNVMRSLDL